MLGVLATTTIYGIVSIRLGVIPVWAAGLVTATIPIGIITLAGLVSYVPNAVVVPMSIIWATIGAWVLVARPAIPGATPSHRPSDTGRTGHA